MASSRNLFNPYGNKKSRSTSQSSTQAIHAAPTATAPVIAPVNHSSSSAGWHCPHCTFYHHLPGRRCSMCNKLRLTKQEISGFIEGKPIQPPPVFARSNVTTVQGGISQQEGILSNELCPIQAELGSGTDLGTVPDEIPAAAVEDLGNHNKQDKRNCKNALDVLREGTNAYSSNDKNTENRRKVSKRAPTTAPNLIRQPYLPGPVPVDTHTSQHWVYPQHGDYPVRQYQLEITESALFHNTLVSLPTGLGKTLIAAVVLYNYYSWFPTGICLFLAPTLPLVHQQVQACYEIMGISARDTAVLTGKTPAGRREKVWQERRVFFCTPQTLHKDLEAQRCPAARVVCIVLDEAHKATGEYAYVQCIPLLEQAGAKFRLLGLSATPGSDMKAIQQVIDALRINKIEARHEADPSVAPYIHERKSEIIVVPHNQATRSIEKVLNDMIAPLLEKLRRSGALPRVTGFATVTPFNIMKAREEFSKRTGDESMTGYFLAAQQMTQIRSDLHKHGVGLVRTRLLRLRNERQRGLMAQLARSNEFQALWENVVDATSDPNAANCNTSDRLRNNPKLRKLQEILLEHFERAKSCNESSRAIVFSQFRDSVQEIVEVLEASKPLIRPRHFVGQGNGKTISNAGQIADCDEYGDTTSQLKGMKQAEQHEVIKHFRNNVYNVLVCTCIGEEGLDIGEVDLIINFDTLRSPIRMIQRTGRTGRKRDGRVVCLVSEGAEEKTLVASKQSERSLMHALKNPTAFRVAPHVPLLPTKPTLCQRNMNISQTFRASQVEGHDNPSKDKIKRSHRAKFHMKEIVLTRYEEAEVKSTLRKWSTLSVRPMDPAFHFPVCLRKRILIALSSTYVVGNAQTISRKGRTAALLSQFEFHHAGKRENTPYIIKRSRASRNDATSLDRLFPTSRSETQESCTDLTYWEYECDNVNPPRTNPSQSRGKSPPSKMPTPIYASSKPKECGGGLAINCSRLTETDNIKSDLSETQANCTVEILPARERSSRTDPAMAIEQRFIGSRLDEAADNEVLVHGIDVGVVDAADACKRRLSLDNQAEHCVVERPLDVGLKGLIEAEDFKLPSQSDSSCSDSETDLGKDSYTAKKDTLDTCSADQRSQLVDEVFQLPSPGASSCDDASDCGEIRRDVRNQAGLADSTERNLGPQTQGNDQRRLDEKDVFSSLASSVCAQMQPPMIAAASANIPKNNNFRNDEASEEELCSESQESHEILLRKVLKAPKRIQALMDYSQTPIHLPCKSRNNAVKIDSEVGEGKREAIELLTNTPESETEPSKEATVDLSIVCAVCFSGESPDVDPILLCDGLVDGRQCDLPVHVTCYSVTTDFRGSEPWRCDPCEFRYQGGRDNINCSVCGMNTGPLKRYGSSWRHVRCETQELKPAALNKVFVEKQLRRAKLHEKRTTEPDQMNSTFETKLVTKASKKRIRLNSKFSSRAFLDEEARVASDEDIDGDDEEKDEILAIEEEEELMKDFINDSSQLGHTQDGLEFDDSPENEKHHRALDQERDQMNRFATPVLNRMMKRRCNGWSKSPSSVPSSERGLGRMHFIRSVLEHHRQGGRAEDIENFYHEMEVKESLDNPTPAPRAP